VRQRIWPVPALAFLVIWGLTTHGKFSNTGDEPHYLVMAESLRADGDLDLANNYAPPSAPSVGDAPANDGHARPDRSGALRSVHEPGLAVLVLPIYAVAVRVAEAIPPARLASWRMGPGLLTYAITSLFMLALSCAALALLTATLARELPIAHARVAVWLAAFSPPLLANTFLIFPEVPALLVTCLTLWAARGPGRSRGWSLAVASAALGLLPWLHRKFILFAVGLLFVLYWERRREPGDSRVRRVEAMVAFTVPVVAFLAWSWLRWGSPLGPLAMDGAPFTLRTFLSGAPGLLIDRENGLLIWAPIYLAALVAWWHTGARNWTLAIPAALLFVPSAAHDLWWGGFAPAARFLVPLVPFLVVALASQLARPLYARAVALLCVPQLVISAIGWQRPRALWPRGDGHNRVLDAVPGIGPAIQDLLPGFRTGPLDPIAIAITVGCVTLAGVALVWTLRRAPRPPDPLRGVALHE